MARGEWEAWLKNVGSCSLCPRLERCVSGNNFLDKTLIETEVGRGFLLPSVTHYARFQHSSVDTTVSLFIPYVFSTQAFYLA